MAYLPYEDSFIIFGGYDYRDGEGVVRMGNMVKTK